MKKPTVAQVTGILELLARFHPAGLGVLLGQIAPPNTEEIAEIIDSFGENSELGVRISGGKTIPKAERVICLTDTFFGIVESIGGWEHIAACACEVRDFISPKRWQEATDYAAYVVPGGRFRGGEKGEDTVSAKVFNSAGGAKHDISERTARRRFRSIMRMISIKILSSPPDVGFQLLGSVSGGYPS